MSSRMLKTIPAVVLGAAVCALFASAAQARPLKLYEIAQMAQYIECIGKCDGILLTGTYEQHVEFQDCMVGCGYAPRVWEKNGIDPIDWQDHKLALLEYQDQQSPAPLICYDDADETIVVPGALCSGEVCEQMPDCTEEECDAPIAEEPQCEEFEAGPVCWWPEQLRPVHCPDIVCTAQPVHTFQQCADADGDGMPAWLEAWLKTDPNSPDFLCNSDTPCDFHHYCVYSDDTGRGNCQIRECGDNCTAFHMEMVAQDDQEVIVHVFYDFTPVPARALDLYIKYGQDILTLVEARALSPLVLHGKSLATTHLADKTLRLSVLDTTGTHPIPNGPIIELVFSRHGAESTLIAFSKNDEHQLKSVAPLQGNPEIQALLTDDSLWGPGVLVPELSQVTTILKLWYGFDSPQEPLSYTNVPDAQELCDDFSPCANEPDAVQKAGLLNRLEALQEGSVYGGESINGLAGSALYLNGTSDHLRLPVHYRKPLAPGAQSFSASTWFYTEGNSANELKQSPQVVMEHLAFNERTRFGLALRPEGDDLLKLVFFSGDMLGKAPPPEEVVLAEGILERTWHHAGFALDAASGQADLYFDGQRVGEYEFQQPPAAISCPQFFASTNVLLHEEGDILGGKPAEFIYTAAKQGGMYSIHRMDPSGLSDTEIIGDSEFSYRDPDYSPIVDRLVYSSNASGEWEIWISEGDGSNRRQLTLGFGNSALGYSARRPRFAPDASAIVFDSNAFDVEAWDNDYARVRHLYYIKYDPVANEVDIPAPGGVSLEQLEYQSLLANQDTGSYRLTGGTVNRQHFNARWLKGKDLDNGSLGELLFSSATPGWKGYRIQRAVIEDPLQLSQIDEVGGLGDAGEDFRLLAAHHSETAAIPQPLVSEQLLYNRSSELFVEEEQFTVSATASQLGSANEWTVTITHEPSEYSEDCWDRNHNMLKDADEDRNGDQQWDKTDCYPAEIRDLFIEFDPSIYVALLEDAQGEVNEPGAVVSNDPSKELELTLMYPAGRAFVRVEVRSPLSVNPLGAGEIAVLHFEKFPAPFLFEETGDLASSPGDEFQSFERVSIDTLVVRDLVNAPAASCADDVVNGSETDLDCGGGCAPCPTGYDCASHEDCETVTCQSGRCVAPTCVDGAVSGEETDVDCGGDCAACPAASVCMEDADCQSGVCAKAQPVDINGTCQEAACGDGTLNGKETDVDCGGECGDKCGAGKQCLNDGDCASAQCLGVFCAADHCGDGFKSLGNDETDLDCGGECRGCPDGKECVSGLDCLSGVCTDPDGTGTFLCGVPTCGDGQHNGGETDVDCGGGCAGCGSGQSCLDDLDCAGGICAAGHCAGGVFADAGMLEWVEDAVFAPDGNKLLLDAISQARPVLLRTSNSWTAAGSQKVLLQPWELRGLDWVRKDMFMACNWAGGYLHPQNKNVMWGLRGGLDDLKVYSGLRDPDAFRSEAERGLAFLKQGGLDGQVESKLPSCANNHLDCPEYHLCVDNKCTMVACDPSDPYGCAEHGGRCTLRPVAVEQEFKDQQGSDLFEWVCAADCNVDSQCFGQSCLNGPCLYCDPVSLSCIECKKTVVTLGELTYETIEGCPDANSFRCENGACVTDCYSYADDESVYLCDAGLEYCYQGECVVHDWDWWDLAPASFQGGHATPMDVPPDASVGWYGLTQAVDQRIPIRISAYGVSDFGVSPEVAVEVRGGPFFGGEWHRIVNASVTARSMAEAQLYPIVAVSPYPFDSLRLRLLTSPYDNLVGGATGLGDADKDFCLADLAATAAQTGQPMDPDVCYRRAQGSRFWLGYRSEIPRHEAMKACKEHGLAGCPLTTMAEHNFLWGGQPAAVVLGVEVDGGSAMNSLVSNKICAYGSYGSGAQTPLENDRPKKVFYGDITTEQSPQKDAFCLNEPDACQAPGDGLIQFDHQAAGHGLLNCNVYDPKHAGETAAMVFNNIVIVKPWPASSGSIVLDNGNQCIVEVTDMLTSACYGWDDATVSLDGESAVVFSGESTSLGSLDLGLFRSFGHDEGFEVIPRPKFPLTFSLVGYEGAGLKVKCGGEVHDIPAQATVYEGCPLVKEGRKVKASIVKQPSTGGVECALVLDATDNKMKNPGKTVPIFCGVLHLLGGSVTGMESGVLKLMNEATFPGLPWPSKELLNVTANGPYMFTSKVPEEGTYSVSVAANPIGFVCSVASSTASGTMGNLDITNVSVSCEKAVPHDLKVNVTGLQGEGLTLLEKHSGSILPVPASGTVSFPKTFYAGEEYEIAIKDLPKNPNQDCALVANQHGGGSGTMGESDTTGAQVQCTTLDKTKVKVNVTGLMYEGLKVNMAGETVTVPAPASSTTVQSVTFGADLYSGDSYSVVVVGNPGQGTLAQVCNVLNGQGTWESGDATPAVVEIICIQATADQGYKLGGTVKGLKGSVLYVSYPNDAGKIALYKPESGGDFEFYMGGELLPGTKYEVVVANQPSDPIQNCSVNNGSGVMPSETVKSIEITCVDAFTVTVDLDFSDYKDAAGNLVPSEFNGADIMVKAFRVDIWPDALVAVAPSDAEVKNGKAVFQMRAPVTVPDGEELPLAYLPGMEPGASSGPDYRFYLFVNRDNDSLNGKPFYEAVTDYGAILHADDVENGKVKVLSLKGSSSDFLPLGYGEVDIVEDSETVVGWGVVCWWLLEGQTMLTVPPGASGPFLLKSKWKCQDLEGKDDGHCGSWDGGSNLTGNYYEGHLGLPVYADGSKPTYHVQCWADCNNSSIIDSWDESCHKEVTSSELTATGSDSSDIGVVECTLDPED